MPNWLSRWRDSFARVTVCRRQTRRGHKTSLRPKLENLEDRNLLSSGVPSLDLQLVSSGLLADVVYGKLSSTSMAADGAVGVNSAWEQGQAATWYIEEQRAGEALIIAGVVH